MLTKRQWLGVGILVVMIVAVKVCLVMVDRVRQGSMPDEPSKDSVTESAPSICLHYFDPNTADSASLLQLGLRPWQIRNMMRYRAKGGRYHHPEDFQSLYGLTDSAYQRLVPYIRIDSSEWVYRRDSIRHLRWVRDSTKHVTDSLRYDSILRARHIHPKRDTMIELNTTDTADLQYIRGVGRYLATQIVRYREQLGGYVDVNQVREIPHTERAGWDTIIPHLTADTTLVRKIAVNHCSVNTLASHPYLRFEQAQAIYKYRRMQFQIHSIDELSAIPQLTQEDIARLRKYLIFD